MNPELEYAEEWLAIPGYEGSYEVSNCGRLRSLSRTIFYSNGRIHRRRGKLLLTSIDRFGYLRVSLCKDGKERTYRVHFLVADVFIGPRPVGLTVDHKDGRKTNNAFGNLEYVTNKEQMRRAQALGLIYLFGEKSPNAKLTNEQVVEIRRLALEGFTHRQLSEQFGVTHSTIGDIVRRKSRRRTSEGKEL